MKKLKSLIKATMSQDMDLFKNNRKTNNKTRVSKIMLPAFLALIVMLSVSTYAFMFADELSKNHLTYIMLTLFIIITTLLTFIEGIYKSQGILFDAKDNNLLLSLPIEKSKILFSRILKLIVFQYLYNALFLIPAFIVYIIYEKPGADFYAISILTTFLLPLIPTVASSIIGYAIKAFSTKFKAKKIMQTLITSILFLGIFYLSFNTKTLATKLLQNATSINELLMKIYYPAGLYIRMITNFNILDLIKMILVSVIPIIAFIYLASIYYFKIISKASEGSTRISKKMSAIKKDNYKKNSQISALVKKEIKRYFSSPVYMFNTSFGVILMLVITIGACINLSGIISIATNGNEINIDMQQVINLMPKIYYELAIFTACMTSITSSSISLEGKSFEITKSLPVSIEKILKAKIITSEIIALPLMIISSIIFFIVYKVGILDIVYILLATIIMNLFIAIIGLLVNLKYPKMNASSDTEVVKQSMSSMVSVFTGMIIGFASIIAMIMAVQKININIFIPLELISILIISLILWNITKKYGEKRFKEINV